MYFFIVFHSKGTLLNFLSWLRPQCQSSNTLKKSTSFIAICSIVSWVNCFWYICIYIFESGSVSSYFTNPASANDFFCSDSSFCKIVNISFLTSVQKLAVSLHSYFLECLRKAVAAYIEAKTTMDGLHLQYSTFYMLILTNIIPISATSLTSLCWLEQMSGLS